MVTSFVKRKLNLSEGEQGIVLAYIGVACFGAGISFTIVNQMGGQEVILRPLTYLDLWMIFAGMVGACAGLWLNQKWLGHGGIVGLLQWVVAVPLISAAGSVVGGTIAIPLYGTMFGPFLLVATLWSHPLMAAFWIANLAAIHVFFLIWRRESPARSSR